MQNVTIGRRADKRSFPINYSQVFIMSLSLISIFKVTLRISLFRCNNNIRLDAIFFWHLHDYTYPLMTSTNTTVTYNVKNIFFKYTNFMLIHWKSVLSNALPGRPSCTIIDNVERRIGILSKLCSAVFAAVHRHSTEYLTLTIFWLISPERSSHWTSAFNTDYIDFTSALCASLRNQKMPYAMNPSSAV